MFRPFALFSPFALFRTPWLEASDPVDPGPVIPAHALVTADGIPLVTADGEYLTTQA